MLDWTSFYIKHYIKYKYYCILLFGFCQCVLLMLVVVCVSLTSRVNCSVCVCVCVLCQLGELIHYEPSSDTSQSLSRPGEWSRAHRMHSQVQTPMRTHWNFTEQNFESNLKKN